jgi:hypothetical protein
VLKIESSKHNPKLHLGLLHAAPSEQLDRLSLYPVLKARTITAQNEILGLKDE